MTYASIPAAAAAALAMLTAPATAATFNPKTFGANIEKAVGPISAGWAYSIVQNGVPVQRDGGGNARSKSDGLRAHGPHVRQNLASVSKPITAIAVMHALGKLKLPAETPVAAYLPAGWQLGPNMNDVTFSDLMRHTSGIPFNPNNSDAILGYDAVKAQVLAGTTKRPAGGERSGQYSNMNFAMLRVLLPGLWSKTGVNTAIEASKMFKATPAGLLEQPQNQGDWNALAYLAYVQKNVMEPVGINGALCSDRSSTQTLYYTPAGDQPGRKSFGDNDWTRSCGGGGWYLSTNALTNLLANVRNGQVLLPEYRDALFARRYGWNSGPTTGGTLWFKDGVVGAGGGTGAIACLMALPNKIEAAVVINSATKTPINICETLKKAYEDAWV